MFQNLTEIDYHWSGKGLRELVWPPPQEIPPPLLKSFTLNGNMSTRCSNVHNKIHYSGQIPVVHEYYQNKQNGGAGISWDAAALDDLVCASIATY